MNRIVRSTAAIAALTVVGVGLTSYAPPEASASTGTFYSHAQSRYNMGAHNVNTGRTYGVPPGGRAPSTTTHIKVYPGTKACWNVYRGMGRCIGAGYHVRPGSFTFTVRDA